MGALFSVIRKEGNRSGCNHNHLHDYGLRFRAIVFIFEAGNHVGDSFWLLAFCLSLRV